MMSLEYDSGLNSKSNTQEQAMVAKNLSTELVSLINYVELNKNGWWKKATSQVILGYLWESEGPVDERNLRNKIKGELNVDIPIENISAQIEYLLSSGTILKRDKGLYLTEATRKALRLKVEFSNKEDKEVEESFRNAIEKNIGETNTEFYWINFKSELISSVRKIGANTYSLLQSGRLFKTHDWLNGFLSKYPDSERPALLKAVGEFFSASNALAKSYILKLLNAYFFVEASQLSKETIQSLEKTRKSTELKIVLDTNFVFSILGLHENPADESATSLLSLAEKMGSVKVRYYILPTTLEEIRRVVSYQLEHLKRHRYSPHLAKAAVQSGMRSSIAAKYFAESARSENGLAPDAYFLPFTDGLLSNLGSKGIKILEWNTIQYPTDDRVVTEQLNLWSREEKKPEHKRKRYEAIEHDLIFWYSIHDHRDGSADSALEETYWGVTIDWSMIQFDQYQRRTKRSKLPVVLHPTNLVQLLQFWVPRDDMLESGIMEAIKLPLLFGDFDVNDEKATIDLIQALSTYKNIDGIDLDILSSMLADKALKQKIIEVDAQNGSVIEIIESEFAELAATYKAEIKNIQRSYTEEKTDLVIKIDALSKKIADLEAQGVNELVVEKPVTTLRNPETEDAVLSLVENKNAKTHTDQISTLQSRIDQLEREKDEKVKAKVEMKDKAVFLVKYILLPPLIIYFYYHFLHFKLTSLAKLKPAVSLVVFSIFCYLVVVVSSAFSKSSIEKKVHLKNWWLVILISNLSAKIIIPLVVALIAFKDEILPIIDSFNG